ncbi:hypothetical protein DRO61_00230 [Candidatus Bathyarchaeota archaeon]|nr:MAG: hypothetical protein DRO61_00230 [Candidatus Bathyarchaeota archaeon]
MKNKEIAIIFIVAMTLLGIMAYFTGAEVRSIKENRFECDYQLDIDVDSIHIKTDTEVITIHADSLVRFIEKDNL